MCMSIYVYTVFLKKWTYIVCGENYNNIFYNASINVNKSIVGVLETGKG
jgi:hypothetical protein